MVQIDNILVGREIAEVKFACDLKDAKVHVVLSKVTLAHL
jgi:hypothetical protein